MLRERLAAAAPGAEELERRCARLEVENAALRAWLREILARPQAAAAAAQS